MSNILNFLFSFILIIIMSCFISNNFKKINIINILKLLTIEIIIANLMLNSIIGFKYIEKISYIFQKLMSYANHGTSFVFGEYDTRIFFFSALCPIIFVSTIIGILKHTKVLNFLIRTIGILISKISGIGNLESFSSICSLILGQPENLLSYKNIIDKIPINRMFNILIISMSTVSLSIIGIYINMISPKYIFTTPILNIFSTFIIISIINPPNNLKKQETFHYVLNKKNSNILETLIEHMQIGSKIIINIAAIIIGFTALIYAINEIFLFFFNINFHVLISYIFLPFSWAIGIPKEDLFQVSYIMSKKILINEFAAMIHLKKISKELSEYSIGILSIFLISFSNISFIGIISSTIKEFDEYIGNKVAHYGFKLIYGSILSSMLSASIASLFISC